MSHPSLQCVGSVSWNWIYIRFRVFSVTKHWMLFQGLKLRGVVPPCNNIWGQIQFYLMTGSPLFSMGVSQIHDFWPRVEGGDLSGWDSILSSFLKKQIGPWDQFNSWCFLDWEELDWYFLGWGSLTLPIFRYEGLSQEQFHVVIGMLDKFSENFDHLILHSLWEFLL